MCCIVLQWWHKECVAFGGEDTATISELCCSVCCSDLQCIAMCCSDDSMSAWPLGSKILQWYLSCVAVCCSVLQCVAVCCSVLQCVAVCCNDNLMGVILHRGLMHLYAQIYIFAHMLIHIHIRIHVHTHIFVYINLCKHIYATHCNARLICVPFRSLSQQHTPTHYNAQQLTATHCNARLIRVLFRSLTATHYNTLQHTTTHCNTPQRAATHFTATRMCTYGVDTISRLLKSIGL